MLRYTSLTIQIAKVTVGPIYLEKFLLREIPTSETKYKETEMSASLKSLKAVGDLIDADLATVSTKRISTGQHHADLDTVSTHHADLNTVLRREEG